MLHTAARQARYIAAALRHERLSAAEAQALQDRKLRAMVHHAYATTPFYRRKFRAAGLSPRHIRTVADLRHLPPTTKDELRACAPAEIVAGGYAPAATVHEATSGSSGKVLQLYHAHDAYDAYAAYAFRHLWELGYRPWHRVAYTAFDPLPALPWERVGLGGRHQVDLRKRDPRSYVEDLLRLRPQLITAYPSILLLIIGTATPAELARIRPRAIHLHSELLTAGIRAAIGDAFGCDCFDDYSTFEFHQVAFECRQHRYHIAADNVAVEFVRDGAPVAEGQEGEIVLTGLTNRAMPLLRYAIGDIGVAGSGAGPCPCGRGFPTMGLVEGRVDDFLALPSGRRLSPRMVNPAFEHLPGILEHVLVQDAAGHVRVSLNVAEQHQVTTPGLVRQALADLFGEPLPVEVTLTTEFERGRTGKLRCIVSYVAPPGARTTSAVAGLPATALAITQ